MSTQIAWAAGLFEGEGSLTNSGIYPKLYMAMTDLDVVERFMKIVGIGTIHVRDRYPHKTQYSWQLSGKKCKPVVEMFLPYFGERRAYKALNILDDIECNLYQTNTNQEQ
jgi:hypothetical protein